MEQRRRVLLYVTHRWESEWRECGRTNPVLELRAQ